MLRRVFLIWKAHKIWIYSRRLISESLQSSVDTSSSSDWIIAAGHEPPPPNIAIWPASPPPEWTWVWVTTRELRSRKLIILRTLAMGHRENTGWTDKFIISRSSSRSRGTWSMLVSGIGTVPKEYSHHLDKWSQEEERSASLLPLTRYGVAK